jgi:hypothetical protein
MPAIAGAASTSEHATSSFPSHPGPQEEEATTLLTCNSANQRRKSSQPRKNS